MCARAQPTVTHDAGTPILVTWLKSLYTHYILTQFPLHSRNILIRISKETGVSLKIHQATINKTRRRRKKAKKNYQNPKLIQSLKLKFVWLVLYISHMCSTACRYAWENFFFFFFIFFISKLVVHLIAWYLIHDTSSWHEVGCFDDSLLILLMKNNILNVELDGYVRHTSCGKDCTRTSITRVSQQSKSGEMRVWWLLHHRD